MLLNQLCMEKKVNPNLMGAKNVPVKEKPILTC